MGSIARDIYTLSARRVAAIDIVYGSAVPIHFNMMDITLPDGAAVVFYAQQQDGPVYRADGWKADNTAGFTPPEGFFKLGYNLLQVEINGKIIPVAIDVKCHERLSGAGSEATPEQVRPLVEQALSAAREALQSKNAAAGSAQAAAESKEAAEGSADAAGKSAEEALKSKNAAAGSAQAAKGSQDAAAGSAQEAAESKEAAEGSADAAGKSAEEALQSKNAAAGSAQAAKGSQDAAAGSAQAAQEALEKNQAISVSTPYIGGNGNWYVYDADTAAYKDSGVKAQGPKGDAGTGNVSSVCGIVPGDDGNVTLTAQNVGARPDSWMPTAADVGARPDNWVPTAADVGALAVSGGAMSGPIAMGGKKVTGLGSPTATGDAANKEYVDAIVGKIYPVGAIYLSASSTSPAELFGGTWERLKDRFLLAAGDSYTAGSTGGEATHTLTEAEMPNHYHQQYVGAMDGSWGERSDYVSDQHCAGYPQGMTGSAGGSQPHNNMPPYLAVYMWKRVA